MQAHISRLAEVAGAKAVLAACEGLGAFVAGIMAAMVDNSAPHSEGGRELLSLQRLALGTCHSAQGTACELWKSMAGSWRLAKHWSSFSL